MRIGTTTKIVTSLLAGVILLPLLLFSPARSAVQPVPLYAIDNGDNELAVFDLRAQTAKDIGSIGPGALALAFCPQGGLVAYTITSPFDPAKQQLATLNLATGAATLVGSPPAPLASGQALDIMGMTCSRQGILYAVGDFDPSDVAGFNSLYTIDRETGQAIRIGSTDVLDPSDACCSGFFMALAFAPDGTLYGATDVALYRIDTSSGHATWIVNLSGVPLPYVMGLAIDSRGTFYIADYVPASRVYTVDTTTGAATPILNTGLAFVHNIAFRVPF